MTPPAARRAAPGAPMAVVLALGSAVAAACGAPAPGAPPTIPAVDFTPKVVIEVRDDGLRAVPGPKADPAVRTDPLSVPEGTLVEIRNLGTADHRVRAESLIDSGLLRPGESVPVALTKDTTEDTAYVFVDTVAPDHTLPITLRPRPQP